MLIPFHHGCSLRLKSIECQYGDLIASTCTVGKTATRQLALRSRDGLECDLLREDTKNYQCCSVCLWQLFTTVLFTYGGYLTNA